MEALTVGAEMCIRDRDYSSEKVNYGFGLQQTNAESTGAVSTVYAENIDKSSAFSIGNSLYGNVLGLTTMQLSLIHIL